MAANVEASGMLSTTRANQATSEAGPAMPAAMAGSVMTPVPSTAPVDSAAPCGTDSRFVEALAAVTCPACLPIGPPGRTGWPQTRCANASIPS